MLSRSFEMYYSLLLFSNQNQPGDLPEKKRNIGLPTHRTKQGLSIVQPLRVHIGRLEWIIAVGTSVTDEAVRAWESNCKETDLSFYCLSSSLGLTE